MSERGRNVRLHRDRRGLGRLRGRRRGSAEKPAATACCCSRPAAATAIPGSTSRSATPRPTPTRGSTGCSRASPRRELNGRTLYQPRGKVLGGTSSINGMVYMRGTPADYDDWRQRGCEGWDWDSVLPFFKKAEDQERGADEFHGVGGPLNVSNPVRSPLGDAMVAGRDRGRHPGQPRLQRRAPGRRRLLPDDDQQPARRWSAAQAYLKPAREPPEPDDRAPTRTRPAS